MLATMIYRQGLLTSTNMADTYMTDLAAKLNIEDKKVLARARELCKQVTSKKSLVCSESCKVVVCLDLAMSLRGMGALSRDLTIAYSGCKKSAYVNMLNNISKLLDLDHVYTVKELCLTLGVSEAEKVANDILKRYKQSGKVSAADEEHPMYPAAAVAAACRFLKLKINQSKAVELSRLKRPDFEELSKQMDKTDGTPNGKQKFVPEKLNDSGLVYPAVVVKKKKRTEDELEEEYQEWKRRMLAE